MFRKKKNNERRLPQLQPNNSRKLTNLTNNMIVDKKKKQTSLSFLRQLTKTNKIVRNQRDVLKELWRKVRKKKIMKKHTLINIYI